MLKGIVNTVSESDFIREFENYGRQDNFSTEGLRQLFQSLEDLSEDMGEPVELDVIGLCCDFNEDDLDDVIQNYDIEVPEVNNFDKHWLIMNHLKNDEQGVHIVLEARNIEVEQGCDALEVISDYIYDEDDLLDAVIDDLGLDASTSNKDEKIEAVREFLQEQTYFVADYELSGEGHYFLYQAF